MIDNLKKYKINLIKARGTVGGCGCVCMPGEWCYDCTCDATISSHMMDFIEIRLEEYHLRENDITNMSVGPL